MSPTLTVYANFFVSEKNQLFTHKTAFMMPFKYRNNIFAYVDSVAHAFNLGSMKAKMRSQRIWCKHRPFKPRDDCRDYFNTFNLAYRYKCISRKSHLGRRLPCDSDFISFVWNKIKYWTKFLSFCCLLDCLS